MLIAVDVEMLYRDGIRYQGTVEMVNGLFHIDFKNKIYVLAETEGEARMILTMLDLDGFCIPAQRSGFSEATDLYICRREALEKKNVKVVLRSS
jgi:hypothetical protein